MERSSDEDDFESASEGGDFQDDRQPAAGEERAQVAQEAELPVVQIDDQSVKEKTAARGVASSSSPPQAKPTVTPAPAAASAWSWGGFLSSAVSAVGESLGAEFKDLGEGLRKVTTESVDRVYETLDPTFAAAKAGRTPSPRAAASIAEDEDIESSRAGLASGEKSSSEPPQDEQEPKPQTVQVQSSPGSSKISTAGLFDTPGSVFNAIDKTFDFTSDLLGNAVLSGYRSLEAAKLGEKLGEIRENVGKSEVYHQSREAGGTLLSHGLTALEAIGSVIGSKAAEGLVENARLLNTHRKSVDQHGTVMKTHREATLVDYFEDNCGQAHLQALEMLATESSLKVKSFGPTVSRDTLLKQLEAQFDMEDILEEIVDAEHSVLVSTEGFQEALSLLDKIGVQNHKQITALRDFIVRRNEELAGKIKSFDADLDQAYSAESQTQYLENTFFQKLKELKGSGTKTLADFAEKACEQVLRIAEILLMMIAEEKLQEQDRKADESGEEKSANEKAGKPLEIAKQLCELTRILLTELQYLCTSNNEASRKYLDLLRSKSEFVPASEDATEMLDRADAKLKELANQMDVDLSSSMTFVQDAIHSNLAILKLMHLWSSGSAPAKA